MRLLAYSKYDPAGRNIASHLEKSLDLRQTTLGSTPILANGDLFLFEVDGRLVKLESIFPDTEWLLCLSRHSSASGKRCLTAHTSGNLTGNAELGGNPREVAISNPKLQSNLIRELLKSKNQSGLDLQVTLEATHHGPTSLPVPVTFVEIGSDESAWKDEILGGAVASAVKRAISTEQNVDRNVLGVGGGHYPEKFTSIAEAGDYNIGHIIPRYAMVGGMDVSMVENCIAKTAGGCSSVCVDWKGTPSQFKDALKEVARSLGVELVKV